MPRISYFPIEDLVDPELRGAVLDAARYGTPLPECQAIRAHVPDVLRAFTRAWDRTFLHGVCDHDVKELCRRYVLGELPHDEADRLDDRAAAAVDYARAIVRDPAQADHALWTRLRGHFTDSEIAELGWFVGLVFGQLRWLRTVHVGRGEVQSLNRPGTLAAVS